MAQLVGKLNRLGTRSSANGHTPPSPEVEATFQRLADEWSRHTQILSSVNEIVGHPAYQQVIAMGPIAVPLILRELQKRPAHWFAALREITGENPVPAEDAGRMRRMQEHWLNWGRERGLV
jgi:hypothetical protein